jgi:hypothetical protein
MGAREGIRRDCAADARRIAHERLRSVFLQNVMSLIGGWWRREGRVTYVRYARKLYQYLREESGKESMKVCDNVVS